MKNSITTAVTPAAPIQTSTSWAVRRLDVAIKILNDVGYDTVEEEWGVDFRPCTIMGTWNPDGADRVLRFAQHVIFSTMEKIGLPLWDWADFDAFVASWKEVTD